MTTASRTRALTGTYTLDPTSIRIGFVARHVVGPAVHGTFHGVTGSGHLDADRPAGSNVDITVDAASIDTGSARRDAQLRAAFLDVGHHPTIGFTGATVVRAALGGYRVTGHLTLRGVSRVATFDLQPTRPHDRAPEGAEVHLTSTCLVSRRAVGVVWDSVWNAFVADRVSVTVEATLGSRSHT
jgi:polyisoprenoid-binding protein YceI